MKVIDDNKGVEGIKADQCSAGKAYRLVESSNDCSKVGCVYIRTSSLVFVNLESGYTRQPMRTSPDRFIELDVELTVIGNK